ncbi:MAG: hypothetical protein ACRYGC_12845 [Janthinobacterium lividum]
MAQAHAGDRLTPALVGLTGYYVVAGFASLNNIAAAVWVMGLVYCVPVVAVGAALAWVGVRRAVARRAPPARVGFGPGAGGSKRVLS